jgi:hypothetical protein
MQGCSTARSGAKSVGTGKRVRIAQFDSHSTAPLDLHMQGILFVDCPSSAVPTKNSTATIYTLS